MLFPIGTQGMWFPGTWKLVAARSWRAARQGDHDTAARIAESYARRRPNDPDAWDIWARASAGAGRDEDAEVVARRGLDLHSGYPPLVYFLGKLLIRYGRHTEARKELTDLLSSASESPLPYLGLASIAAYAEEWEKARRYVAEAVSRGAANDRLTVMDVLGIVLDLPGEADWAKGIAERAARLFPREWFPHLLAGLLGDGRSASRHLRRARRYWRGQEEEFDLKVAEARSRLQRSAAIQDSDGRAPPSDAT